MCFLLMFFLFGMFFFPSSSSFTLFHMFVARCFTSTGYNHLNFPPKTFFLFFPFFVYCLKCSIQQKGMNDTEDNKKKPKLTFRIFSFQIFIILWIPFLFGKFANFIH